MNRTLVNQYLSTRKGEIVKILSDLIKIDTVFPHDCDAFMYLSTYIQECGIDVTLESFPQTISTYNEYTKYSSPLIPTERNNLRAKVTSPAAKKSILLQSHIDVVPLSPNYPHGFIPHFDGQYIYGRGACDAKGNVVMAIEAIRAILYLGLHTEYDIYLDIVIEEEIGGNGALGTIIHGISAEHVIVLEPTDLQVFVGHRGCLTFEIEVFGRSVHMGSSEVGISAIDKSFIIIQHLRAFEQELINAARQDENFNIWTQPVQLNIGQIEGGEWPGSVPERCRIVGNVGFLPIHSIQDMQRLLRDSIMDIHDDWIREHVNIKFKGLKNDSYIMDKHHPLPTTLYGIAKNYAPNVKTPFGWKVSCDARLYSRLLGLPTVIFGCGSLNDAHSNKEKVALQDILSGITILVEFLTLA